MSRSSSQMKESDFAHNTPQLYMLTPDKCVRMSKFLNWGKTDTFTCAQFPHDWTNFIRKIQRNLPLESRRDDTNGFYEL